MRRRNLRNSFLSPLQTISLSPALQSDLFIKIMEHFWRRLTVIMSLIKINFEDLLSKLYSYNTLNYTIHTSFCFSTTKYKLKKKKRYLQYKKKNNNNKKDR